MLETPWLCRWKRPTRARRRSVSTVPSIRQTEELERRTLLSVTGEISYSIASGKVFIDGTSGNDVATVTGMDPVRIVVRLETGSDVFEREFDRSQVSAVVFHGDEGDDRFVNYTDIPSIAYGGRGHDELIGGRGNDRLMGEGQHDLLVGGDGNDTLKGFGGRDTIDGGSHDDLLIGAGGDDSINGAAGRDTIKSGRGDDCLCGGAGDDTLSGGTGDDLLHEAADADFLLTDAALTGTGADKLVGIERVRLDAGTSNNMLDAAAFSGAVTLFGTAGDDTLVAGPGGAYLSGANGNDCLVGFDGADTLIGGAGLDTLSGGAGNDLLEGGGHDDVADGQAGDDTVVGAHGNDLLRGGDGRDWLDGGDGSDTLDGGHGNDLLDGVGGDDFLSGGNGQDALGGGAGRDILLGGGGADSLSGGGGDDLLIGSYSRFDYDPAAWDGMRSVWIDSSMDYTTRVALLSDSTAAVWLAAGFSVYDDGATDHLFGNADMDWMFMPGSPAAPTHDAAYGVDAAEVVDASAGPAAFPGAEGYAAAASGGRGGRVIEVTNRNDDGPGSLRAAVEAEGPRIVVFQVAGTITLHRPLEIINPNITIAGQSSPGNGITLTYSGLNGPAHGSALDIQTSNVIIRYLRVRRGEALGDGDSVHIRDGSSLIMLDHLSITWGTDENLDIYSNEGGAIWGVTVQNSLIAEGLNTGNGSAMGVLISGLKEEEYWRLVSGIDVHHNVMVNNTHRNPRVLSSGARVINNLAYNWQSRAGSSEADTTVDWIGNYFQRGPNSNPDDENLLFHATTSPDLSVTYDPASIYIAGNIAPDFGYTDPAEDNWPMLRDHYVKHDGDRVLLSETLRRDTPLDAQTLPITVDQSGTELKEALLDSTGANARLNADGTWTDARDPIDARLIDDVVDESGPERNSEIPTSAAEASRGYSPDDIDGGYLDSDADGMADAWEEQHGFDKLDPSDGSRDSDADGWTNVEEFLNGSNPHAVG